MKPPDTTNLKEHLEREVRESHTKSPDPDEPWRYVCPECGGTVRKHRGRLYRCDECNDGYKKRELFDKKRGKKVKE